MSTSASSSEKRQAIKSESAHTCVPCGATESKQWRGMRVGRVVCARCYHIESQEKRKLAKRKKSGARIYDMWGG